MLNRYSGASGFTLIELMIAVSLLGVLLAIGVPAMRDWITNTQINTAAEAINNGLQLARSEAVRRNTNVHFTLGTNSAWIVGCETIQADNDGDGVDDCPGIIQTRLAVETTQVIVNVTPAGAGMVTFGPLGRVTVNADTSQPITQLDVSVPDSVIDPAVRRDMRVLVSGGSVRLCKPSLSLSNDPRACPP